MQLFAYDAFEQFKSTKPDMKALVDFHQSYKSHSSRWVSSFTTNGLNLKIYYGDPVKIFETLSQDGFDEVIAIW